MLLTWSSNHNRLYHSQSLFLIDHCLCLPDIEKTTKSILLFVKWCHAEMDNLLAKLLNLLLHSEIPIKLCRVYIGLVPCALISLISLLFEEGDPYNRALLHITSCEPIPPSQF